MSRHPTLAQLRERVHKQRHREIGNWLARRIARPSAVYGTWLAVRLGLSAHHVTVAACVASGAAAIGIGSGTRAGFVGGAVARPWRSGSDRVDGQVAAASGTSSLDGVYFDYMMHHAANLALGFARSGHGLARRTGEPAWSVAGFADRPGLGAMLSLHNDCRYKAFFQELKRRKAHRVEGDEGRPSASPWPRRGRAALTWPASQALAGPMSFWSGCWVSPSWPWCRLGSGPSPGAGVSAAWRSWPRSSPSGGGKSDLGKGHGRGIPGLVPALAGSGTGAR